MKEYKFDESVSVETYGGMCPVQVEGTIDGKPFYFRGRHNTISLAIASTSFGDIFAEDAWYYEEVYGDDNFAAGCIPLSEVAEFINKAIKMYKEKL